MRSKARFLFVGFALVVVLASGLALAVRAEETAEAADRSEAAGLGVEVSVASLERWEEGVTCTAVVTHLGTGEVLTAPTISFLYGEHGQVTSRTPDGALVRFRVEIDKEGTQLSYNAEYLRDDRLLAAQKATVELDLR